MQKIIIRLIGTYINLLAVIAPGKAKNYGFKIWCHPFRSKLNPTHLAFLNPGKLEILTHKENQIQTYRWGNGPTKILFLHGWQSHTYRWKNYIESLDKEQFTIYSFDAPGHGLSTGKLLHVPLYSEITQLFLAKNGPMDSIISHSLGGFASLYTLSNQPVVLPKKLVIMASPAEAQDFVSMFKRTLKVSDRAMNLIVEQFVKETGKEPSFFSAQKFAHNLNVDGLIIHDEGDEETVVQNAKDIHAAWPKSQLVITKGLGHNLKSAVIVKQVNAFVGGNYKI
jgi:pimeloyl-ACP methyl ester carboxylesterase